jgi:xylan 1,4-beta-xylosidase
MTFTCDTQSVTKPFAHFWEHTVGSGHATLALRADWQKQLARCHTELGFKHVRFHGILCDDMGTLINDTGGLVYSFFNANQICDFLLSIGMRPFMEMSFMPSVLASGNTVVFHYEGNVTPPRDYAQWETLINKLVANWTDRYGIAEVSKWLFEIWNEPNLSKFWTGTQADYFKLYQHAASAIKAVSPQLQVGGPATANSAWVSEFLVFCAQNKVPVDFVSTHHYPNDNFGQPGEEAGELSESRRSVLREEAAKVQQQAQGKPLYYTEWSISSIPFDALHDMPYAATFIIKTVMEAHGYVQGYSYWTFSDIFEENYFNSIPFHGGFGLMNIYGIPKPAYRAFQLLHGLGEELLPHSGSHDTVDIWVTKQANVLKVLVTNSALPLHPVKTETITICLSNVKKIVYSCIEKIDENHANARAAWVNMGQPGSLSPAQVLELEHASELVKEPIEMTYLHDEITIKVVIAPHGTACITIETI